MTTTKSTRNSQAGPLGDLSEIAARLGEGANIIGWFGGAESPISAFGGFAADPSVQQLFDRPVGGEGADRRIDRLAVGGALGQGD